MTLIVENGIGLPDAESLCSVVQATAFHAAQGNAAWAALASDEQREQLLRRATRYMRQTYGQRWAGMRVHATQALDWPRAGVVVDEVSVPIDIVPREVVEACAELALRAITRQLTVDEKPLATRVKVGPIEKEYAEGTSRQVVYAAVDALVAPYLQGSGGSALFLERG